MIYVKRSVDDDKDVLWVAADLDETAHRGRQLYLGKDVNCAIDAAVKAGMSRDVAENMAKSEIARCKADIANDELAAV